MSAGSLPPKRYDPSRLRSVEAMLSADAGHSAKRLEIDFRGVAPGGATARADDEKLPVRFVIFEPQRLRDPPNSKRHTLLPESLIRASGSGPNLTHVGKSIYPLRRINSPVNTVGCPT
jgi:hypothetical protein